MVQKFLMVCFVGLIEVGCSSIGPTYRPSVVGDLKDAEVVCGLQTTIVPDISKAVIGDLISFRVKVCNVSDQDVWFTKKPIVIMTWIYPEGKRDNWIREIQQPASLGRDDVKVLRPGESFEEFARVTTYYFAYPGITEFRAVITLTPRNIEGNGPFWTGKMESNAYGIPFKRRR